MKTLNTFWVLGHRITTAVSTGNYDLVEIETPANTPGPPPHVHHKYTEFFLVTEGEVEFLLNGERKVLKAGSSVDIPPGSAHTYRNNSNQPCRMVNIHSPKGFVNFFKTIGISAVDPRAQKSSLARESIEKATTMAGQFDIEFQKEEA